MVVSPDDSHIYITSPDIAGVESKLYVFKRNTIPGSGFGEISFVEIITQGVGGVDGLEDPVAMSLSATGQSLYVLSNVVAGTMPAIAIFNRNTSSASPFFGQLTFQGVMTDSIPVSPESMLLSADQEHIYVSGDGTIQRYKRDIGSGLLTYGEELISVDSGELEQSPDGSQLYVVDAIGGDVNAFSRVSDNMDPNFGDLSNLNSVNHADISNVSDVVLSSDGKNLYLTSTGTNMW